MQGKFVELAIGILKEKPTPEAENIRSWAVRVLNTYSGVEMNAAVTKEIVKQVPLQAIIFDGSKLINIETLKRICWRQVGVPDDTLLIDFMLKREFGEKRIAVEKCMNNELIKRGG